MISQLRKYILLTRDEIWHIRTIFIIAAITLIYTAVPVYVLDYRFAQFVIYSNLGIFDKIGAFIQIYQALFTAFTPIDVFLLTVTGVLIGMNIVIFTTSAKKLLYSTSGVRLTAGGGGLIGLLSAGCTGCGTSIASAFGVSVVGLSFIPYANDYFYLIAILLSVFSIYYMLKNIEQNDACVIKKVQRKNRAMSL